LSSTVIGNGRIAITIWVQDFAASIAGVRRAAAAYVKKAPNVAVRIQVIPYTNLQSKVLPAVAAGTEADIINAYNSWFVAADISRMFLPLDDYVGGRKEVGRIVFPNALNATATPGGRIYYMPYLAGMNVCSTNGSIRFRSNLPRCRRPSVSPIMRPSSLVRFSPRYPA
jgi:ABC-type glycerol-3-phosphate transport system substrate-binding protein